MGNNFNQNNNTNTQTNNHKNYGNNKRFNKPYKSNPNELKVSLHLPTDLDETINTEIVELLPEIKFDKISIPLGTYKYLIDQSNGDDDRVSTIGYIRNYDRETKVFTVVIFDRFIELIKSLDNLKIELKYVSDRNGHLRTITKFNILPIE